MIVAGIFYCIAFVFFVLCWLSATDVERTGNAIIMLLFLILGAGSTLGALVQPLW